MIPNPTKYLNALKHITITRVFVLVFDDCPKNKNLFLVKKIEVTININTVKRITHIGAFKILIGKNLLCII